MMKASNFKISLLPFWKKLDQKFKNLKFKELNKFDHHFKVYNSNLFGYNNNNLPRFLNNKFSMLIVLLKVDGWVSNLFLLLLKDTFLNNMVPSKCIHK